MTTPLAPAFTPAAVDATTLAGRTVGRDRVIERLGRSVREAARSGGGRAHVLVVGPRGAGKTHVLRVATHVALHDERLAAAVEVVVLPEDAPDILTYADLLHAVLRHQWPKTVADLGSARTDPSALERRLLAALNGRTLVLVIENLDRLFDALGTTGRGRLRGFVETSRAVLLLASTPTLFEAVSDHDAAWYGAFHAERLGDLDVDEGAEILGRFAEEAGDDQLARFLRTDVARSRLRALVPLTGGSPRMWTILAGRLTRPHLDELSPLVFQVLDDLVRHHQAWLDALAATERKLVVELGRPPRGGVRGAVRTAGDLADASGVTPRVASTVLARLERSGWVTRHKLTGGDQRVSYYEIAEPMLRHHLEHRETVHGALAVVVAFLKLWFAPPMAGDGAPGALDGPGAGPVAGGTVREAGPMGLATVVRSAWEGCDATLARRVVATHGTDDTALQAAFLVASVRGASRDGTWWTAWRARLGDTPAARLVGVAERVRFGDASALLELPSELRDAFTTVLGADGGAGPAQP